MFILAVALLFPAPSIACAVHLFSLLDETIWDTAFLRTGEIVMLRNFRSPHVLVFNKAGVLVNSFGPDGSAAGALNNPVGLGVDPSTGEIFVAELSDRVVRYRSDGSFVQIWGHGLRMRDVAADGFGNVFVAEGNEGGNKARIPKFTRSGVFITKWGESGPFQFGSNEPTSVATDAQGHVFVATGQQVRKYSNDGVHLRSWHAGGRPTGLAVASNGDVLVADQLQGMVRRYSGDGMLVCELSVGAWRVAMDSLDDIVACSSTFCAVYTDPATPVNSSTWGRLKTQYR